MVKKSQFTKKVKSQQDPSKKVSIEELYKKYGIVFKNTTEEHLRESTMIFINRPKKG